MKRTGNRPGARPGPAAVTRTCGSCGKRFACVARSVADQIGLCLRCFERKVRFPGLCQRP